MTSLDFAKRWTRRVLPLLASGCIVFVGPGDRDDSLRELVSARARWNASGMADYEYVLRQRCFCLLGGVPVRVLVRGGSVVSAVEESTGQSVAAELLSGFVPVERLFDIIEDAISRRAFRIDASYDPAYGFPADFFIDMSQHIADEEVGYTATSYRPLR